MYIYDTIIFLRRERSRPRIESPNAFIVISFGKQKSMTVTDRPRLWGYKRVRERVGYRNAIRCRQTEYALCCVSICWRISIINLYPYSLLFPLVLSIIYSHPYGPVTHSAWSCHAEACRGVTLTLCARVDCEILLSATPKIQLFGVALRVRWGAGAI